METEDVQTILIVKFENTLRGFYWPLQNSGDSNILIDNAFDILDDISEVDSRLISEALVGTLHLHFKLALEDDIPF